MMRRLFLLLPMLLVGAGCGQQTPALVGARTFQLTLVADGAVKELTTGASNVRELLEGEHIELTGADEVIPPLFTPLNEGMTVSVVRVSESIELIERSVPFSRKLVRSESLAADDPPVILQVGRNGLEELTVRIVYRDGIESERRLTQVALIEDPQDEILMIGIGADTGNLAFAGIIAYMSGGSGILLRGNSAYPEQINTGQGLDGRVYTLSPTGSHLLFTRRSTLEGEFNQLYVISTEPGAGPRRLGVSNVLWAGWNPAQTTRQQIAYSRAEETPLPPGWEANNDLWVGDILRSAQAPFLPRRVMDSYPATYGWWGGNYAWSPTGDAIAFAYADEIGIVDLAQGEEGSRTRLQAFTEYTSRGDWAWVPTLSWSPDGRILSFSKHVGDNPTSATFDAWAIDIVSRVSAPLSRQAGMWAHPTWAPANLEGDDSAPIAFLQASTPLESERASYTLWIMDQDGSNRRQLYPQIGETSRFPHEAQFMSWGPTGRDMAFIFNDDLFIFNVDQMLAHQVGTDDAADSNPSWAPYGAALESSQRATEFNAEIAAPTATPVERLPFENQR